MNSYIILFCLQNLNPEIQSFLGLSQPVNRAEWATDFSSLFWGKPAIAFLVVFCKLFQNTLDLFFMHSVPNTFFVSWQIKFWSGHECLLNSCRTRVNFMPDFVGCLALILGSGILTLLEILNMQKQSSGCVLRNFVKFVGIYLCQSLFLNKVAGLSVKLY